MTASSLVRCTLMLLAASAASLAAGARGRAAQEDEVTDWKVLTERFRSGEMAAVLELTKRGPASVRHLVAVMEDDTAGTARFMAANILGDIGDEEALEALVLALGDPWVNVRRCAALALGKIGDPRARPDLERVARDDPFASVDPASGETMHLVRDDARAALAMLDLRREIFLDDAARRPPAVRLPAAPRCRWPFPGGFLKQNVYNDYQQATGSYTHAALDLLQPAGTAVRAVARGRVVAISTNYPAWKTHHFFIVAPFPERREGWCYTHVDPDSFTFEVGDDVRTGQRLGTVVRFSVGDRSGVDHLHLHYVSFEVASNGEVTTESLFDPLLRFDWTDDAKPTVHGPLQFVRAGTLEPLAPGAAVPVLSGKVDVVVAVADRAHREHVAAWMTPVVTIEITSSSARPWRKLVLDQRGPIAEPRAAPALHVSPLDSEPFCVGLPRSPTPFVIVATHTDGDGIVEASDARQCWNTAQVDEHGQRRFPDGEYSVTIRAWDLAGNHGEATTKVRVANPSKKNR